MVIHIPVLQKEVLDYLRPKQNENFIDCTVGGGGHTLEILKRNGPNGKVLGIEWDRDLFLRLQKEIKKNKKPFNRLILVNDNFARLKEIVKKAKIGKVSGILIDLGMSSWHLERSGRGFSFLRNEPLDMRYDPGNYLTAEKIVNYYSFQKIREILSCYGEERFSNRIARNIIKSRSRHPIKTTFQLVKVIKEAIPINCQHKRIHFATRTFQALRIAVNDEMKNLEMVLPQTIDVLKKGGRIVVISFHSLEDRIVKRFLKEQEKNGLIEILTKKPISASKEEIFANPRARSAKLRAAKKL